MMNSNKNKINISRNKNNRKIYFGLVLPGRRWNKLDKNLINFNLYNSFLHNNTLNTIIIKKLIIIDNQINHNYTEQMMEITQQINLTVEINVLQMIVVIKK